LQDPLLQNSGLALEPMEDVLDNGATGISLIGEEAERNNLQEQSEGSQNKETA
jgi:hypothetical protein